MVDWKLYIDSPQQRALDFCYGSLTEDDGDGGGYCVTDGSGWGCGGWRDGNCYGSAHGSGWGDGYGKGTGDGGGYGNYNDRSSTEW